MGIPPQILQGVALGAPIGQGLIEARATRAQGDAEANADAYNARLALMQGRTEADRRRKVGHAELTRQFVQMSAGGVRVEGTPLDFLANQAREIERDATNAEIEARNTARLDRARGAGAQRAAKISAGTALLSGGTKALATGYRFWGT